MTPLETFEVNDIIVSDDHNWQYLPKARAGFPKGVYGFGVYLGQLGGIRNNPRRYAEKPARNSSQSKKDIEKSLRAFLNKLPP